jgi:transcriptional regulator with XRE-family HTH domain
MNRRHRALVFSALLHQEMNRQGVGVRELARRLNPDNPASAKRQLSKWRAGDHLPSRENRQTIARALNLPERFFEDADDEEEDALIREVASLVRRHRQTTEPTPVLEQRIGVGSE